MGACWIAVATLPLSALSWCGQRDTDLPIAKNLLVVLRTEKCRVHIDIGRAIVRKVQLGAIIFIANIPNHFDHIARADKSYVFAVW